MFKHQENSTSIEGNEGIGKVLTSLAFLQKVGTLALYK
jgi:hypothetical protein